MPHQCRSHDVHLFLIWQVRAQIGLRYPWDNAEAKKEDAPPKPSAPAMSEEDRKRLAMDGPGWMGSGA